ncbi:MAG TPA: cation ABC transporter substrate-binding protein [Bacteroidales bacterium]|jgi:zinc transport system substrate-binding protein|nr:cation ABC transporter substrate-binding protein [Bacteroidales bacterium]
MKKHSFKRLILACALILVMAFVACTSQRSVDDRPLAVVSILPQKSLVEAIAGKHFEVMVLVPEEGNHETYEPEARQLANMSKALVYFKNGLLGFEKSWLPGIAQSNPEMKVVNLSEGIQLIRGHEIPHGDHIHEGGIDPHFWLSVSAVRIQAGHVAAALKQLDPEHAQEYDYNHLQYLAHLDSLDLELKEILKGMSGSSFMIFHPSLGYFARDYHLEQIAIEYEGKEPGPAYLRSLVDVAREKNIRILFVSSQFSSKSAEVIARQINAGLKSFNPTALDWEQSLLTVAHDLAAAAPNKINP